MITTAYYALLFIAISFAMDCYRENRKEIINAKAHNHRRFRDRAPGTCYIMGSRK